MKTGRDIVLFWSIMVVGLAVHVLFWALKQGMHHPDEIFQYIEPAFVRLEGMGWLPWEFDRGVRNWTLIAYYGGWMKLFMLLGAQGEWLHKLICLHNAVLALAVVPAVRRLGERYGGESGGWMAAMLAAVFPPIAFFSPHSLSEVPSMVLSTWGIVLWLEGRGTEREMRCAFLAGALCGFSVVARFFSAVLLLVPLFDYLFRAFRKNRAIWMFVLGGLLPLGVLAISDWITWGAPLHSAIEYFRYNILEWKNAVHGTSPWWQYLGWLFERLNFGLILFIPLLLIGILRARLLFLTICIPLVVLSLIAHKEERFMLCLWPLVLVIFAAGTSQLCEWVKSWHPESRLTSVIAVVSFAAIVTATSFGVEKLEWRWLGGILAAQSYVGRQPDATGCMFRSRQHLTGGYVYLDRNIPMISYRSNLSHNPLFNYFIFTARSREALRARRLRWEEMARFDDIVVFRRPSEIAHREGKR